MGNGAPDSVRFLVDAKNSYGHPGTSGRAAALGITAETVDTAIQRNKHAIGIHHTDSPHITVSYGIPAQRFFTGVFHRLLDGGCDFDVVSITAIYVHHFDQNALAGLESTGRIHPWRDHNHTHRPQ